MADEDTACSDLALEAARQALSMAIEKKWPDAGSPEEAARSLDLILVSTATPDYYGTPPTACIVQNQLGARNAAAMDITAGCTGFIYGLETAAGLLGISNFRKRALVIGSEILTRVADWNDRGTCVLFGDGAGAVLLERTGAPAAGTEGPGLRRTILGADGTGWEHLIIRRGGSRNPYKTGEVVDVPPHIDMDGRAVYNFAVKAVAATIRDLLEQENISIREIARIIPHQANARIVQAAGKRLGIPEEKFFLNIEKYANTSAASIPIALDELNRGGEIKKGDILMTIGFGGGLTFGGNLIVW
jgi:3-oxoacyl-[acyl-carrier-protein] synthase-3